MNYHRMREIAKKEFDQAICNYTRSTIEDGPIKNYDIWAKPQLVKNYTELARAFKECNKSVEEISPGWIKTIDKILERNGEVLDRKSDEYKQLSEVIALMYRDFYEAWEERNREIPEALNFRIPSAEKLVDDYYSNICAPKKERKPAQRADAFAKIHLRVAEYLYKKNKLSPAWPDVLKVIKDSLETRSFDGHDFDPDAVIDEILAGGQIVIKDGSMLGKEALRKRHERILEKLK